jgi:Eco57I restriction-modification methylase
MLTGLSGSLLSHDFAERVLHVEFAGRLGEQSAVEAHRVLRVWRFDRLSQLGPVSSVRSIWNIAAAPLAEHLGFEVHTPTGDGDTRQALLTHLDTRVGLLAGGWSASPDSLWRDAVRSGIALESSWCLCTNGHQLRLVDTHRTYSRAFVQFDLQQAIDDFRTFQVFWGLLRAGAFRPIPHHDPLVLQIIHAAARHGQAVNRSLRFGVIESLQHFLAGLSKCGKRDLDALFDESLTVVYRILFLMFAEARGLVPNWHPLYKKHYTIESLRERIERPGSVRGLWETLQAIARLAHRGCHAGTLVVPAFNGRLFAPSRAPIAESCAVDDEIARKALLGLSTTTVRSKRTRIHYRDLGVEQLGAVYESVLEYEPVVAESHDAGISLQRGSTRRKSTGSFYTPQPLTDYLVRRTLYPLVAEARPEDILNLRVVDPAMGSAAFLVSACRYLARAYEGALIREAACSELDIDEADRAGFRRQIAQRCLFGVDFNPTAVQLARLSLWLATLSANKPLTFLDHRLVCGDSLLGASPVDIGRQPPGDRRSARQAQTSLFAEADLEVSIARAVGERRWVAETTDDTIDVVREKERRLERLRGSNQWKALADLWCACWMWPETANAPDANVFSSLSDEVTLQRSALPRSLTAALLKQVEEITRQRRFFHWALEFPEAYFDDQGQTLARPGFDAVLGNPPWDMLRADSGEKPFLRSSGIYRYQGGGHINRYQVFLERAMTLARHGGRIGLVLPWGFATDHTAARLRRYLLAHSKVDTIIGFDNRKAIFPIHRSVRFVICTTTMGEATRQIACRFGIDDPTVLEGIPDAGDRAHRLAHPITLTPALIASLSGDRLTIPELRSEADVRILEGIVHRVPRLGDVNGWNVRFGRELNATDDRRHFHIGGSGLPVLEGKHIEPFRAHPDRARQRIPHKTAATLLEAAQTFMRRRLAYRDVASSTNRLSLLAAILPAGVVTTHSLFCLKTRLSGDKQAFLCGMLNSFVANYLVRQVMTTHLGSATVEGLRVPKPRHDSFAFIQIVDLTRKLGKGGSDRERARLQALAAWCYGLAPEDFGHVLSTFPLVPEGERNEALMEFRTLKNTCASA